MEASPSTLPAREQEEDVSAHTHTEVEEHSEEEYDAWGFDAFEVALDTTAATTPTASRRKAPTRIPTATPKDYHAAATTTTTTTTTSQLQSSLAADLFAHRTSALPAADPGEVARPVAAQQAAHRQRLAARRRPRALPAPGLARQTLEALHGHGVGTAAAAATTTCEDNKDGDDEREVLAHYFWQFVHAPCAALGLQASILLARCLDLAQFSGVWGRYEGAERGTVAAFGVGAWARRIFVDREVVMPALFAAGAGDDGDAAARAYRATDGGGDAGLIGVEAVRDAIAVRARRYFEALDGLEGLVVENQAEGRWMFSDVCKFRLNARGMRLDASRKKGASGFGYSHFATLKSQRRLADDAVKSLEQASNQKAGDIRLESDAVFMYMPWVPL
ncbi:hypothetical protein UCDDS831_g02549 [Diplodia seriata]|uniref:Uncharacterized protein n=1 Tax=Diplodia seriata TaxID=420778 RepID=A0A0G2EN63_9PEZI|nr:hypothetical protein UCDDS831_g02549 [Diplodia seriata]